MPVEINVRCIHDIDEVEKIWKYFNPNPQNIYQEWNYIKIFYDAYHYIPHFYTAFKNDIPVACIPMEWVPERGRLEMFGNMSFVHYFFIHSWYESQLKWIIESIPLPFFTESICWDWDIPNFLEIADYDFFAILDWFYSANKYIEKCFSPNSRRNLLKQIRKIEDVWISYKKWNSSDLDFFFEQNKKNFWEDSSYNDIRRQNSILFLHSLESIPSHILSFYQKNTLVAVQFLIEYNKVIYHINGGVNKDIKNLWKFTIAKMIDFSIEQWCHIFNLWATELGGKERWCNLKTPLFSFVKENNV